MTSPLHGVVGSLMKSSFDARMFAAVVVACMALLLVPLRASPQEQVPGSPACVLPPVTLPLFDATPAAIIAATPASSVTPGTGSAPLDPATIEPAIEAIVACINTNDPALRYAVFTDRYLAQQLADPTTTYQPAFELQLDTATNASAPQFTIESIEEITPLDDGRVSVVVILMAGGTSYKDRLVLADVEGHWLIDDLELIDPAPPAT